MASIIIEKAEQAELDGTVFELSDLRPAVIGRKEPADLPISDRRASRQHARVSLRYGSWILEDLDSRNGVAVRREGEWKRMARARLRDGELVRIGSTVLRFSAAAAAPPEGSEIAGCRLDRDLGGEAGVGRFAAWQLAMDRPVRLDTATLPACAVSPEGGEAAAGAAGAGASGDASGSLLAPLFADLERAARIDHRGVGTTLQREVAEQSDRVALLFRLPEGTAFAEGFAGIVDRDVATRLRAFALLAELLLAGGPEPTLAYPIGARHIGWSEGLEPWVPALELSAWLIDRLGACVHFPSLVPYLPPERIKASATAPGDSGISASGVFASRIYNLGALGYHLVTGSPPMGEGSGETILKNHIRLAPTPADVLEPAVPAVVSGLLERMLAKDPGERPASPDEVIETLREGAAALPAVAAPPGLSPEVAVGADAAAAAAEEEVEWEDLDDAPAGNASPAAAGRRPARAAAGEPAAGPQRTSLALLLPIWVILWAGLFVATRVITEILLERLRG